MKLHQPLHHSHGLPDWATVAPAARNPWQHVAAATRGVITPGNALSLLGFVLVCVGLWEVVERSFIAGCIWVCAGRLCDLLDGIAADRTGTKSPLGEATDAGFDKAGAALALLVAGGSGIVPWWAVALIGVQNAINIAIGFVGRRRKAGLHPVLSGKFSTALEWVALAGFILAAGVNHQWLVPAFVVLIAALVLGVHSSVLYMHQLHNPIRTGTHGKQPYIGRSFKPSR